MSKPYYEDTKAGIVIYHGDCREVLPLLHGVDHVMTDPPYFKDVYLRGKAPSSKPGSGTPARLGVSLAKLAAGDIGIVDELVAPVSAEIARLTRRWALVFSDVENCHVWRIELEEAGLRFARTGAWVKPDSMPQMSGDRPAVGFEPCTIVHAQTSMRWNSGGKRAVWTHGIARGDERWDHECPKPIELMRELILDFTDPGDVILDCFAGSGTTLRAAKDLGRRAIGIEVRERDAETIVKRLSQEVLALA